MNKEITNKAYIIPAISCGIIIIAVILFYILAPVAKYDDTRYVYIDDDDNIDSVSVKVSDVAEGYATTTIKILARHTGYCDRIRSGRYAVEPGMCAFQLFRHLRNGQQSPVRLTLPSVRTKEDIAEFLDKELMISANEVLNVLDDSAKTADLGYDTATVIAMFIPDTYEVYWNTSLDNLLKKLQQGYKNFWNSDRTSKAESLGLSPVEVITLASIIDEETAANKEKPMVAGMYYNRYKINMPLQADPTVKFALKQFELRRIYNKHLEVNSPYNTYKNTGLPPGPIRIPSVAGIDAVLNLAHHDYLYMCANPDFSGTHIFAKTYQEHLKNAALYSEALNKRNIK